MKRAAMVVIAATLFVNGVSPVSYGDDLVTVGSKKFTESVILGEMLGHLAREAGLTAQHRRDLGGTRILFNALVAGDIDAYPEYTGTISEEILAGENVRNEADMRTALAERGVLMSAPLGFNNTYAIGMRNDRARALGIATISDLRAHPELRFGFTNEFMDRGDGWPRLRDFYQLPQADVKGLDHDLAYRGLDEGAIDVMDLYSTDAEISYYNLQVLTDDGRLFPEYHAVILYRANLAARAPEAVSAFRRLERAIPESLMIAMNARAKIDGVAESRVAADFLAAHLNVTSEVVQSSLASRLWRHGLEHLRLVAISLLAAIVLALPLGVAAHRFRRWGQVILGVVGVIQTIPSLALLVFMIPLLGIGGPPAIVALFLYSLLPIVRNTHAGLSEIPVTLHESATAMGLPGRARLWHIELPMAAGAILAGIKTAAVINVGTATLGALIGAGGYGQPILTGIRLDNVGLILEGALPAAGLALMAQGLFELLERFVVPKGLRLREDVL